uniref:Uncharacterized protein n=1 Tax=Medicago truncatula TaxID=3880 RepID=Q2HTV2_MEDTR|nr:hypothetical protein MtrDRAFT_AC149642g36v2 [Medicago truncatula]
MEGDIGPICGQIQQETWQWIWMLNLRKNLKYFIRLFMHGMNDTPTNPTTCTDFTSFSKVHN